MKPPTPCLDCGTPTNGTRCAVHTRLREQRRGTRQQRGYTDAWLRIVEEAKRRQPFCTDCRTGSDLTGDHIIPLSRGGTNTLDNCAVRCRPCNSRKGTR